MKKTTIFILFLTFLLFTNFTTKNNNFDELIVFYDTFDDNSHNWVFESEYAQGRISNGYYQLTSYGERSDIRVQTLNLVKEEYDFEIEANIKIVGSSDFCNSIIWGSSSIEGNYDKGFSFGYNSQQKFIALETVDWVAQNFFDWQPTEVIKVNDFNKLLIRKNKEDYYFYINNILVKTYPTSAFSGQNFGFHAANGATILVDYYRVAIFVARA